MRIDNIAWVSLKLYVDDDRDMLAVLANNVPELVRVCGGLTKVHSWFFLRFVGADGLQVRLRIAVDPQVRRSVEPVLVAAAHAMRPPSVCTAAVARFPAVKVIGYSYEAWKFGEHREEEQSAHLTFEASSRLALRMAHEDLATRFRCAERLFRENVEQLPVDDRLGFTYFYAHYWLKALGATTPVGAARQAVRRKRTPGSEAEQPADAAVVELEDAYLRKVSNHYAQCLSVPKAHALFHMMHLTCNRLGIHRDAEISVALRVLDDLYP